jgi:hypothetical protein
MGRGRNVGEEMSGEEMARKELTPNRFWYTVILSGMILENESLLLTEKELIWKGCIEFYGPKLNV